MESIQYFSEHPDKWFHVIVGLMLFVWLVAFKESKKSTLIAYGVSILIAAGKELIVDLLFGYGNAEFLDFIFTIIMPTIGLLVSLILNRKRWNL